MILNMVLKKYSDGSKNKSNENKVKDMRAEFIGALNATVFCEKSAPLTLHQLFILSILSLISGISS